MKTLLSIVVILACVSWDEMPDNERIGLQEFKDANQGRNDSCGCISYEPSSPYDTSSGPPEQSGTIPSSRDGKD